MAGFFTQISTLADVQENVMEYLHVLSRPKVIDQEHDVVWTEAYIDSTVSFQGPWGGMGIWLSTPHPVVWEFVLILKKINIHILLL